MWRECETPMISLNVNMLLLKCTVIIARSFIFVKILYPMKYRQMLYYIWAMYYISLQVHVAQDLMDFAQDLMDVAQDLIYITSSCI